LNSKIPMVDSKIYLPLTNSPQKNLEKRKSLIFSEFKRLQWGKVLWAMGKRGPKMFPYIPGMIPTAFHCMRPLHHIIHLQYTPSIKYFYPPTSLSTSKIHNQFHEGPKNMKQLGLEENYTFLFMKIYWKLIQRVHLPLKPNQLLQRACWIQSFNFFIMFWQPIMICVF